MNRVVKIMPRVERDYIETGKVRFIFREALRNDVDTALISMTRCKGEDKFFAITDAIFERQPEIIKTAQAGTVLDTFLDIGAEFGIRTPAQFDACYENMNIRLDMIEVQETADLYELRGTPTLISANVRASAAHTPSALRSSCVAATVLAVRGM